MTPDVCRNCATPAGQGEFCPGCGQRNRHYALRSREILADVLDQIIDWRLPWPRTIVDLLWRPGAVALDYVEGRRARYVNPVKYCFIVIAIVVALDGGHRGSSDPYVVDLPRNVLALLSIPLQVALLRLAFWRTRFNATEIAVLCLFATGQIVLLFFGLDLLFRLIEPMTQSGDNHLQFLIAAPLLGLFGAASVAAIKEFFKTSLGYAIAVFALGVPSVLACVDTLDTLLARGEIPFYVLYLFT